MSSSLSRPPISLLLAGMVIIAPLLPDIRFALAGVVRLTVVFTAWMEPDQLEELDRRLRLFAISNGMEWVVEELDDAVATGVFERRDLRQSTRRGRVTYDEVPVAPRGGRKRAEEFVSRRSLTQEEQVRMMLSGLRRVLADLDLVAEASVRELNDLSGVTQSSADIDLTEPLASQERSIPVVTEIDFIPDEGSAAAALSTEGLRYAGRSQRTADVLRRIEAEVQS